MIHSAGRGQRSRYGSYTSETCQLRFRTARFTRQRRGAVAGVTDTRRRESESAAVRLDCENEAMGCIQNECRIGGECGREVPGRPHRGLMRALKPVEPHQTGLKGWYPCLSLPCGAIGERSRATFLLQCHQQIPYAEVTVCKGVKVPWLPQPCVPQDEDGTAVFSGSALFHQGLQRKGICLDHVFGDLARDDLPIHVIIADVCENMSVTAAVYGK